MTTLKDRQQLASEWVRRFLSYTSELTWFGSTSAMGAVAQATGGLAAHAYALYASLLRRVTLMGASETHLPDVAAERGAERLGPQPSKLLVVVVPHTANVAGIRDVTGDDYIEVDDSSNFAVAGSMRIRSGDGSTSEIFTIASISVGTGPVASGNELVVTGGLSNAYTPASDDVDVLRRHTVAEGTSINTQPGVAFQTLASVTTGDSNPVLDGEGTALSLADKVWCEATVAGSVGNVPARSVEDFTTPIAGVASVYNPEAASGGADTETAFDLKYRAAHGPTTQNQETITWVERLAKEANSNVLRATRGTDVRVSELAVLVMHRNGGDFSTADLLQIETYIAARARSYMTVDVQNVTKTAVAIEVQGTIESGYTTEGVGRAAASRVADFLDLRKWGWGVDVDEADLLALVKRTPGMATLDTASFLPASDTVVGDKSLPYLTSLSLLNTTTSETFNGDLAQSF